MYKYKGAGKIKINAKNIFVATSNELLFVGYEAAVSQEELSAAEPVKSFATV